MKASLTAFSILSMLVPCAMAQQTPAPTTLEGTLVALNLCDIQEASTERGESPTEWKAGQATSMMFQFPANSGNSYSYQLHEQSPDSPWPPVKVTYVPEDACIHITGNDMHVLVTLRFRSASEGIADIEWHDECGSWYVRGASFIVNSSTSTAALLTMPQAEATDGAIQSVDDGLAQLVRELETRSYTSAVDKLYQKRLLTILPQIMEGASVNTTISNANGTTALHNACGLSHVEIVQWLVDHGADLEARTAKGASVDDCVGGPNAKAIRALLKKARQSK